MKRFIAFALFLIMAVTFVGCAKKAPDIVEDTTPVEDLEEVEEVKDKPFEGTTLEVLVAYGGA